MTPRPPPILPVLLAGGSGTRLWPLSRESVPKQFLNLLEPNCSLLQATAQRAAAVPGALPPLVVCGAEHRFIVAEQMRQAGIADARIMLEPAARNTAPAAAVAAHYAASTFGADTLVFLMAADHAIPDQAAFRAAVDAAAEVAHGGRIVTFGILPTHPETGFGYLKAGPALGASAFAVECFVEKPDFETANRLIDEGGHYWNGGMFLFRADTLLSELTRLEPEMDRLCAQALRDAVPDLDFIRLDSVAFSACRSDSIDYAVMERTQHIALVPLDAGWDDVGSWGFLAKLPADAAGNVVRGDALLEDAHNNLIHAESRLVALLGVDDHVIVETGDAVLIAARGRVQDVKRIVQRLKSSGRSETQGHARVYRPWGWYETIACDLGFQVKRIQVNPGQKLSLQLHHHRAEHWVVVRGTARVTRGDVVSLLTEDQSTYIPLGEKHRLENPGADPLEIIEVQSGSYLGEDDIVRFDDQYGR